MRPVKNPGTFAGDFAAESLSEVVTDVLVERGNKQVVLSIAKIPAPGFPRRASLGSLSVQPATIRLRCALGPGPIFPIPCS